MERWALQRLMNLGLRQGATGTATNIAVAVIFWRSNGSIVGKFPKTRHFLVVHGRSAICPSLLLIGTAINPAADPLCYVLRSELHRARGSTYR